MTDAPIDFEARAQQWAVQQYGQSAGVRDFGPMPGNSGLSFGFEVLSAGGALVESVVVRLAPPGVRRSGNTDVLRQVPLLQALSRTDVPVAPLLWHGDDSSAFGTDAIVQRRLDGRSLNRSAVGALASGRTAEDYVQRAVEALTRVHAVDWESLLPGWGTPVSVEDDLAYWQRLLDKAADPQVLELAARVRSKLIESQPKGDRRGLFHGDFQPNNVLYDANGDVLAIVDWEIAGVGRTGMDVGWLSFMLDKSFWGPEYQEVVQIDVDPALIRGWYQGYAGVELAHFGWYRAYAAYRFGTIAAYNVRLHRTGRRPDPVYETMASSVPVLFQRGLEVVAS